tara:strand:+ start:1573 stop:2223 length:651 start_codon:yes stop_codon:yes gene_type:complete
MSKKRGNIRLIEIDPTTIPANCNQIVITQNKTRVVIKNDTNVVTSSVDNKHDLIMKKVRRFFDIEENFLQLKPILTQESEISLRVLDWSTTNWSRKNTVILETTRNGSLEKVNMFLDYKANLKAFSKRSFDPFCRRERIMLKFSCDPEQRTYISTTAQLNFMKWAIETGVLEYCRKNITELEHDMVKVLRVNTPGSRESIARQVTASVGEVTIGLT